MTDKQKIEINLTKDEALVLFEFVSRLNETGHKELFQDQAEEKIMWLIEGQLEEILVEPFMPNYNDIITEARNKLRAKE